MHTAPPSTPAPEPPSPWRRRLITLGIVATLGAFVWSQLPDSSYPTDLSRIGQGQATVVLTMESHYLEGASVMHLLHDVRDEFGDSVQFLVASLSRPDGRAFVMQALCMGVDPDMSQESLATLGDRLAPPAGWSYRTRVLEQELVIDTTESLATVLQDEFETSYTLPN